jgi:hypothetical protein
MSSGEKRIAVVLVVILIGMVGAYFAVGSKMDTAQMPGPPGMGGAGGPGGMMGAGGMAGQGGAAAATTTVGPEGAKVEIIALVPIANPCHAATVSVLKQLSSAYPNDVRLTLIEFMGPDSAEWRQKLGVTCATVSINGQYTFNLEGRTVIFQQQEGGTYRPVDLKTVVEAELARAG